MITTVNQRVRLIVDQLYKGNKRAFAIAIEVSPTVVENVLGKRQGNPSFEVIQKICAKANISADWLLFGKGEMMYITPNVIRQVDKTEIFPIPLYQISSFVSLSNLFKNRPELTQYITIPGLPECDGAIHISGESMQPLLKSGDIILFKEVKNWQQNILWGEMYLLSFESGKDTYTMVRWLQPSQKGKDHLMLMSESKQHPPIDIALNAITAMAYVKASIRINSIT